MDKETSIPAKISAIEKIRNQYKGSPLLQVENSESTNKKKIIDFVRNITGIVFDVGEFYLIKDFVQFRELNSILFFQLRTDMDLSFLLHKNKIERRIDYILMEEYPYVSISGRMTDPSRDEEVWCKDELFDFMIRFKSPSHHKQYYDEYLKSEKWIKFRALIFKQRGFICELCNSKKNLHLHHLTYEHLGYESEQDVMILCEQCHKEAHQKNDKRPKYLNNKL